MQAALLLDRVQRVLRGINEDTTLAIRSIDRIGAIQKLCFEAGAKLSKALSVSVNTKIHRTMRHVKDHIITYGCIRRGETDNNETLHRNTKASYPATNHKLRTIGEQLVKVRTAAEVEFHLQSSADGVQGEEINSTELLATLLLRSVPVPEEDIDTCENDDGTMSINCFRNTFERGQGDAGAFTEHQYGACGENSPK